MVIFVPLLLGCSAALVQFGPSGPADDTGGPDTDPGRDDTGDSSPDTGPDSGDTDPAPADVTYVPTTAGAAGSTLGLYRLGADYTVADGGPSVTAPFEDGRWAIDYTPVPADYPDGLPYVIFVAYASDADGGGLGISEYVVLYCDGAPSADLAALGFSEGWNAFHLGAADELPVPVAPQDLSLDLNLVSQTSITVSGSYSGTVSSGYRLAVYPFTGAGAMLYDGDLAASWSFTVSHRPSDSAMYETNGVMVGGGTPFAYKDADGSGSMSHGDTSVALALLDSGETPSVIWVDPIDDPGIAYLAVLGYGLHVGWGAYVIAEGEKARELDATELTSVRLDP